MALPVPVKFLSAEPLIGRIIDLDKYLEMDAVQWVIVGGESGPGARPMDADWAREIRDDCISKETAFFFKQWGGVKHSGEEAMLDGKVWHEFPQFHNCTRCMRITSNLSEHAGWSFLCEDCESQILVM